MDAARRAIAPSRRSLLLPARLQSKPPDHQCGFPNNAARHLGLPRYPIWKDDGVLHQAEPSSSARIIHLDLKAVTVALNRVQVNCPQHTGAETFKPSGAVMHGQPANQPRVHVATLTQHMSMP